MRVADIEELGSITCYRDVPLARCTSMQVGGPAAIIAEPGNKRALARLLTRLRECDIRWFLLGDGTNTIFSEEGFRGVIIKLGNGFEFVEQKAPDVIETGAATSLVFLLNESLRLGLSGLEFCFGIPGTVGGAAAGNAGMDGFGLHDRTLEIRGVTPDGEEVILRRGGYQYAYRRAKLPDMIITSLVLRLAASNLERRNERLERYQRLRSRQPAIKGTAGSIFKNPQGDFAGRLIETAGLKGRKIGGACVSSVHANWILNTGNATANDVLSLIGEVQKSVEDRFGIILEPEVRLVG